MWWNLNIFICFCGYQMCTITWKILLQSFCPGLVPSPWLDFLACSWHGKVPWPDVAINTQLQKGFTASAKAALTHFLLLLDVSSFYVFVSLWISFIFRSPDEMICEKSLKSLFLPCLKLACIHLCDFMLGSRFKRPLVPLGLMSAAASVCYPAQAVAVVKVMLSLNVCLIRTPSTHRWIIIVFNPQVTGKKVYAAGQWSGAAVSSLFISKPEDSGAKHKHPTSPQPQVSH